MSYNAKPRVAVRRWSEIFEEAVAVLRQDSSEFAVIALIGAVPAALAVLIPGTTGSALAISFSAPLVVICAVAAFAASTAAITVGANHLQPEAGRAYASLLTRPLAVFFPWLPLIIGLWAASYAAAAFVQYIDPVPTVAVVLLLAGVSAWYAFPRTLWAAMVFEHDVPPGHAQGASAALVRAEPRRFATTWLLVTVLPMLMALIALAGGFDAVLGAIMVLAFMFALPFAAAMSTLLLYDASSRYELVPADPAPAPQPRQQPVRTYGRRI